MHKIITKPLAVAALLTASQFLHAQDYEQEQRILAPDWQSELDTDWDNFGSSISLDGNRMLIGDINESLDDATPPGDEMSGAGAVYVFEQLYSNKWEPVGKFVADFRRFGAQFGSRVVLDGNTALVGAPGYSDTPTSDTRGGFYFFEYDVTTEEWDQIDLYSPGAEPGGSSFNYFWGNAVDLEGDFAVAGCPGCSRHPVSGNVENAAGLVNIYQRDNQGNWNLFQKLVASDWGEELKFGIQVCLQGNTLAVSGTGNHLSGPQRDGAVYIFEYQNGSWVETQILPPPPGQTAGGLGERMNLSDNYLVVSDYNRERTFLYTKNAQGTWEFTQELNTTTGLQVLLRSSNIAIHGDQIVIGSVHDDPNSFFNGAVFLFEKDNNGNWSDIQRFKQAGVDNALTGEAVAFDGQQIIFGIPWETPSGHSNASGAVYVYRNCDATTATLDLSGQLSPYLSPSGKYEWTASGTYQDTIINAAGCDSILTINLGLTNSIVTASDQKEVSVFPNPFTEDIQVVFERVPESAVQVQIVDALGRTVYQQQLGTLQQKLTLTELQAGHYFLLLNGGDIQQRIPLVKTQL